ncbi:trace amine-associated receptor 13c-like [Megalops cyprinoides]|uniref:trace amine-associated receptor 13c-like n=1 Tax=Megalops cyprinoides TaxID=118141 RepID=UPI00186561E4|nr:trace amine-associated receptor 13c-like [Megalops cyprinoides]
MDVAAQHEQNKKQYCYSTANGSCTGNNQSITAQVILYIFFVTGMVITILGNLVVIISIAHFKQLHTPTNVLVMSLALADLLLGVTVMPFSMVRSVEGCWYFGDTFCLLHSSFDMFLTSVSIFHLIFIAIDRYQAVCNPLRYTTAITITIAWLMSALSWGVAAIYSYGLLYSNGRETGLDEYISTVHCFSICLLFFNAFWGILDTLIAFFVPCSVMVGLYAKIFLVAREHVRKIKDMSHKKHLNEESRSGLSKSSERKAAKTLGIVVGGFILCWMPFFINSLVDPYNNFGTPAMVFDVLFWFGYFNSTLNPIIYALFYPWFQKTLTLIVTLKIFTPHSSNIHVFSER